LHLNSQVLIFRHAHTVWNAERRLQGHLDIPLSESGRAQASKMADYLRALKVEALWCSDLKRAHETAQIIGAVLQIPISLDSRLREAALGEATGLLIEEIDKRYGHETWKRWNDMQPEFDDLHFPGGESKRDLQNRILSALGDILIKTDSPSVAICMHGYSMVRLHWMLTKRLADFDISNSSTFQFSCSHEKIFDALKCHRPPSNE
jgi:probable phosphoglycerate mutase